MEKNQKNQFKKIKAHLTDSLELPKDLLYGAALVTITGKSEVVIENYKGMITCSDEKIKVQTREGSIEVKGKNLLIEYYTNDEMKITGLLHGILYDP